MGQGRVGEEGILPRKATESGESVERGFKVCSFAGFAPFHG